MSGWLSILIAAGPALSACTVEFTSAPPPLPPPPPTYYVSPSGNDAAAGTSPATAWRTLAKVNSVRLAPGTRVLLQAGQRLTGPLILDQRDAGSPGKPVMITSYGSGTATILASSGDGITVHDTSWVSIKNISLVGTAQPGNGNGLDLYSDLPAGHRVGHIDISQLDVTGFRVGISVGARNTAAGFSDVRISDSQLHGNTDTGLITFGPSYDPAAPTYAHENVMVSGVAAWGNLGDPRDKSKNTGNGIVLGSVSKGTVSSSVAHDNGGRGASVQGPAGIWTYDSTRIDIDHNLAYANKTRNQVDGNGFGLDQNTTHSVMQRNFSYGNDGTGYLVYSALKDDSERDNIVRDNISSYDGRGGSKFYGGVTLIGYVTNIDVYQNTVVMKPAGTVSPPALRVSGALNGVTIRNNIFTTSSGPVVATKAALSLSQVELQGNDYHTVADPWEVLWGEATYGSLSQWRSATAEENVGGLPTGQSADPQFAGPVFGLSVTNASDISAARGFALTAISPLIAAGLDLASLGATPATANFLGQAESERHPNIGAM